jgi:hypothetical protein
MRDREGAKQGVQAEEGVPESGMKKTFFSLWILKLMIHYPILSFIIFFGFKFLYLMGGEKQNHVHTES